MPERNVPMAVTAMDADGDTLRYEVYGLRGDMASFGIVPMGGQITTKIELDYEGDQTTYVIEVTAKDPFGGEGSTMVTITVTNVRTRSRRWVRSLNNTVPHSPRMTGEFSGREHAAAQRRPGRLTDGNGDSDRRPGRRIRRLLLRDDMGQIIGDGRCWTHEAMASHMVLVTATVGRPVRNDRGDDHGHGRAEQRADVRRSDGRPDGGREQGGHAMLATRSRPPTMGGRHDDGRLDVHGAYFDDRRHGPDHARRPTLDYESGASYDRDWSWRRTRGDLYAR